MLPAALLLAFLIITSEARVLFSLSEVLQADDLIGQKFANFSCDNGCTVYVDRATTDLVVTKDAIPVATFADIFEARPIAAHGLQLVAGGGYQVANRGTSESGDFVFYVVRTGAANAGSPLFVPPPRNDAALVLQERARFVTLLTSADALRFTDAAGAFPATYPRLYATGYDTLPNSNCLAVYQARSQRFAEESQPVIRAPIVTVDFGFVGQHSIRVQQADASKDLVRQAGASTVYNSPGYVGCPYNKNYTYRSPVSNFDENFTIEASILDIDGANYGTDTLRLRVNGIVLDLVGYSMSTVHYGPNIFTVELGWKRTDPDDKWALQLDFGRLREQPVQPTTTAQPAAADRTTSGAAAAVALSAAMLACVITAAANL